MPSYGMTAMIVPASVQTVVVEVVKAVSIM